MRVVVVSQDLLFLLMVQPARHRRKEGRVMSGAIKVHKEARHRRVKKRCAEVMADSSCHLKCTPIIGLMGVQDAKVVLKQAKWLCMILSCA